MKKAFVPYYLITCFFITSICHAQHIQWNNKPSTGYVFQISNMEAEKLLSHATHDTLIKELLHTLVDTFNIEKGWLNKPKQGHFILARIIENKLNCHYEGISPYQVFLFKEYGALALQVLDSDGRVREDALVKLHHKRLRIDHVSKTYRIENQWFRGINQQVTVELDGFRALFNIHKHGVPLWEQDYWELQAPDFYSYMITDKNKYKPNEQVRFKSYALNSSKWPLRRELEIWLTDYQKTIKLGTVSPHRPGSYTGEFYLLDTLQLTLDKNYRLFLKEKTGRIVANCSFSYEDYELTGQKLNIQLAKHEHYLNNTNYLTITATDENGLLLKDAKASILVKTGYIQETYQAYVVLPDTLLFQEMLLNPSKPTKVEIPSSLFENTNTSYSIIVSVINSQNQRMERREMATHFYSTYALIPFYSNDSICFELLNNGIPMHDIKTKLIYDGKKDTHLIVLPYKEKINPSHSFYEFNNQYISKQVSLNHFMPKLHIIGGIENDSFNIHLENPQKLEVTWYIYKGSELLEKGFGKVIEFKSIIDDRTETYYVELTYSYGGQEHTMKIPYTFKEGHLNVAINVPDRVFPGQEVNATISVTNQAGKPIKDVDLTALATTSKLNYNLPDLPYYGSNSIPRPQKAHYSKDDKNKRSAVLDLDFKKWKVLAHLDTMKYYQFIYPIREMFKYTEQINDSTQFAPFVMQNGRAKQVYVIEVDKRPVYYSWTTQPAKYSFYISPEKKHEVTLRLYDRVIILDSISFDSSKKTILSIDLEKLPKGTKQIKLEKHFSEMEYKRHIQRIAEFASSADDYAYLMSNNNFVPLFGKYDYQRYSPFLAGPINAGMKTFTRNTNHTTYYKHTGGYRYVFEDNIVYKLNTSGLIPGNLSDINYDPLKFINDHVLTKKEFIDLQYKHVKPYIWTPGIIQAVDKDSKIRILLPQDKAGSGIACVLFESCAQKSISFPWNINYSGNQPVFYGFTIGHANTIVLYNNGTYLHMDSIPLKKHTNVIIDMQKSELCHNDSLAKYWLNEYQKYLTHLNKSSFEFIQQRSSTMVVQNSVGNIKGTVYAEDNNPMPGVNVLLKGSEYGTVTDLDGRFNLCSDNPEAVLAFSFVGYMHEEVEVKVGTDISIKLEPDLMELSEVVVVGYGTQRRSNVTGAVSSISSKNMVLPTEEDEPEPMEEESSDDQNAENEIYRELLKLNSIRSNFSDVGFWEPRLFTDKFGKSEFKITFPDDITQWNACVYAMNRNLQTGTTRKLIKSYKPLMAELHVPQFLTEGDSAFFLGKVLNYTTDSLIQGKIEWSGAGTDFLKEIEFSQFHTDKLPVYASGPDSIKSRYLITRNDGYLDGEERIVPIEPQGTVRANGNLSILQNGDTLHLKSSSNEQTTFEILDNQIDIYAGEVQYLLHYKYACNEQLASKLIGILNYKLLMQYEGKKFQYDKDIKKIIDRLLQNQNQEFLWSWWNVSGNTSYWMSAHILQALKYAKDLGYNVSLDIENIARKASYKFYYLNNYSLNDIELVHSLATWGVTFDYSKFVNKLDSVIFDYEKQNEEFARSYRNYTMQSFLKEKLMLLEIRQMANIPYQTDSLLKYKKEGILGDIYFSDNKAPRNWYNNQLSSNTVAYRIIKNDSTLKRFLVPMQMYFLSSRKNETWNTYYSSNILMNVFPDLLNLGASGAQPANIELSGKVNKTISHFPYHIDLMPNEELYIRKESGIPLICTNYTKERVTKAQTGIEGFKIRTWFYNNQEILEAGVPVKYFIEVEVTKENAEYIMIDIPLPGACSYANKSQPTNRVEAHREYFKERTVIFCDKLAKGKYTFVVQLLPRFTGKYIINPAQVSLMYVPVVNANTEIKKIGVVDKE